ncbi:MAG: cupin domain-containing protein [Nitrospira sp.]|nr:cupin domain-containing protein [Nitrospira sp.]
MKIQLWLMALCFATAGAVLPVGASAETAGGQGASDIQVVPLAVQPFPEIPGKEGAMLTVELAPGASSLPHRHRAHTFVYVLEGSIAMQVEGGPVVTLVAGQTFYESPNDIHAVSKNTSATERAKFVVFFVKDAAAPFVLPVQ